ncbi:hypothetical protein [Nonomuraea sp. LPB2021202275-12-8]|uniref:hypothetical protein n=1 Tax=Nonomuraea sp. LPB2021202275-12-8 TaxID=3120159 RepID=UPI00300D4989
MPASLRSSGSVAPPPRDGSPEPAPASAGKDGVEYATDKIITFTETMVTTAATVGQMAAVTPSFGGWNWLPGAGVPAIGAPFVSRFDALSDIWADCAGILREVLEKDRGKLVQVAVNYRTANEESKVAVDRVQL